MNGLGPESANIHIQNVHAIDNYRNGISVIGAVNLLVEDSIFEGTKGAQPQCGVDIEPDFPTQQVSNAVFRNVLFRTTPRVRFQFRASHFLTYSTNLGNFS